MAYVSESDVRNIIKAKSLDSDQVKAMIEIADVLVQETLVQNKLGLTYSNARLKIIELYVAAHFCAVSDATERTKDIRTGGVRGVEVSKTDVAGKFAWGITVFGQTACMLDGNSLLRSLEGGRLFIRVSRSPNWWRFFRGIEFSDCDDSTLDSGSF